MGSNQSDLVAAVAIEVGKSRLTVLEYWGLTILIYFLIMTKFVI